ncbi:MAG TPA: nucleotide sugar dehydrogenase [Candidatus Saccharimonadales bacterium]|nr:nucleotide sugar dehydrogenase [Candidatus Saccharimonadales bacterium]
MATGSVNTKDELFDICIVGGCGHVGLPLGLAFAGQSKNVVLYDINEKSIYEVNSGKMPFKEEDSEPILNKVLKLGKLKATNAPQVISDSRIVILVIGTPVDEHLNPKVSEIIHAIKEIEDYLTDDQLLVMRSTLYPGVTDKVKAYLTKIGKNISVAFCPERIIEGKALTELYELPQIVAGCTPKATEKASDLFKVLTNKIIVTEPIEAELAKLFTNTWRYINFAISNQFYMIANSHGLDFYNIYNAMTEDYPRLKAFAKAGLAAGPCLFKDTMQLSSFSGNNFFLGHSAMLVNEGLPDFIVSSMKKNHDLSKSTVAILGMAFKGNNDDPRESLSYKLKKKLEVEADVVLCHDPYINDSRFSTMEEIREKADIIVLATPHTEYNTENWDDRVLVDMWNFYGQGGLV